MNTQLRSLVTAVTITILALGAVGFAQPRAVHREVMRPRLGAVGVTLPAPVVPDLAGPHGVTWPMVPHLSALPIGTTIELRFFDADPAEGAEARTELGLTVGVDSEVVFGDEVAAALVEAESWEAAYLVVAVGETRRVVALPADEVAPGSRAVGAHALRFATAGMDVGDSVTVAFYDADPAQGAAAIATLSFTYGVDSAIGFRGALEEATVDAAASGDAAFAEVVTSPRSWTVDLKAVQAPRAAATWDRFERMRERMGDLAERLPALVERMRGRTGPFDETFPWPPARGWPPGRR